MMARRRATGDVAQMSRNAPGEGSWRKRYRKDGSVFYEWRLPLPGGKRQSFYGDTLAEAQRKKDEAKRLITSRLPLPDDRLTVKEWITRWLAMQVEKLEQGKLKATTVKRYRELLLIHVIPKLGHVPLARLDGPFHLQPLYDRKRREVSETTAHHIHTVLHKVLVDARKRRLVSHNACEEVPEVPGMPEYEADHLELAEANQLLETAKKPRWARWEALIVLELNTGLREGELLALTWNDVHLDVAQPFLEVRGNLYFLYGAQFDRLKLQGAQFDKPKTDESKRKVRLNPRAVVALRAHQLRQEQEKETAPRWDASYNLIFPNTVGRPMAANNFLRRVFRRMLADAGLRTTLRFHDLRHSVATLLLDDDVSDWKVSAVLGHKKASFTKDRYGHRRMRTQEKAIEALERMFGSGGGNVGVQKEVSED